MPPPQVTEVALKKLLTVLVISAAALLGATAPALAQPPGGGNGFGQHVREMTPDHAIEHGAGFGDCVSMMASSGECGHD